LNVLHRPSQFLPSSPSFPCFQHRLRGNTEVEILGLSLVLLLDKCGNYLSKTFNSFKFSITGSVMKVKWVYGFEIWEMKGYNYFLLCQESLNPASFLSACVLTLMLSDFPLCPPSPPSTCSNCRKTWLEDHFLKAHSCFCQLFSEHFPKPTECVFLSSFCQSLHLGYFIMYNFSIHKFWAILVSGMKSSHFPFPYGPWYLVDTLGRPKHLS
jgi:hypothetical protein